MQEKGHWTAWFKWWWMDISYLPQPSPPDQRSSHSRHSDRSQSLELPFLHFLGWTPIMQPILSQQNNTKRGYRVMDILTLPCSKVSVATGISSQVSYQSKKDPLPRPRNGRSQCSSILSQCQVLSLGPSNPTPSTLILWYFNTEGLYDRYTRCPDPTESSS